MTPLVFLPSFRGDLEEIWLHVAADDPVAADTLIDDLSARCLVLSEHPYVGLSRPDIASDCRQLVLNGYVILYRIQASRIELVRVLHGRRKITKKHFGTGRP